MAFQFESERLRSMINIIFCGLKAPWVRIPPSPCRDALYHVKLGGFTVIPKSYNVITCEYYIYYFCSKTNPPPIRCQNLLSEKLLKVIWSRVRKVPLRIWYNLPFWLNWQSRCLVSIRLWVQVPRAAFIPP